MQLAIGVILLLGSLGLAPLAWGAVRRWRQRDVLNRPRPDAIAKQAGQPVSVSGTAVAGPGGATESQLARTACVWHGHEVLRHYWPLTGKGVDDQERACDSIADYAATEPFGIAVPGYGSGDHMVLVDPADTEINGTEMCLQRVVARPQRGVATPADDLLARVKGRITGVFRGETIEFEYREWVVRPGAPIVAHGVIELRGGQPVIVAPPDGRLRLEGGGPGPAPRCGRRATVALLLSGLTIVEACAGMVLVVSAW